MDPLIKTRRRDSGEDRFKRFISKIFIVGRPRPHAKYRLFMILCRDDIARLMLMDV